jgi:acyl-CoA thioesterase I
MTCQGKNLIRRAWVGAVMLVLTSFAAAHAQVPAAANPLNPIAVSASPASTPAPMPAVLSPSARPSVAQPTKPAALHSSIAPISPTSVTCTAPQQFTRLDHPLLRTARRLASGQTLIIVAIGSSSTAGAGASGPAASYPSRLAVELEKLLPGHPIKVLNRGVNGEETPQMMARFSTAVIAERPQLVLWQLGTNSVLRDQPLDVHAAELHQGIEELKKIDADLVLIDPQYAPRVLAKSETPAMVEQIAAEAKDENVNLFHRFAIMRDWYVDQHRSFNVFVSADGLHMNDWGYACWAQLLARGIANAANPPVASVAAPSAH